MPVETLVKEKSLSPHQQKGHLWAPPAGYLLRLVPGTEYGAGTRFNHPPASLRVPEAGDWFPGPCLIQLNGRPAGVIVFCRFTEPCCENGRERNTVVYPEWRAGCACTGLLTKD